MSKPFVSLRPEITRTHAMILMDWLEDARVTRYLSDSGNVSAFIGQAINRIQLPILTHLFNQGGRFFMVYDRDDCPVGFVRLIKQDRDCEIVLVIGDHGRWGQKLGASTIRAGLKLAFLDLRAQSVIAKIHPQNTRSLKGFERCGFQPQTQTQTMQSLTLGSGQYFRLLRQGKFSGGPEIYLTELDKARLHSLIDVETGLTIVDLEHEIARAIVVAPQKVASDVVTMNSRVRLQLDDEMQDVALVYPQDADEGQGKVSVLSDVGTAILGYQEGDAIDWVVRDRTRRIRIEKVIYQPEASGALHL